MVNTTLLPIYPRERDPLRIVQEARLALDAVWKGSENLTPTGIWSPDRPAPSDSRYPQRCPCPGVCGTFNINTVLYVPQRPVSILSIPIILAYFR